MLIIDERKKNYILQLGSVFIALHVTKHWMVGQTSNKLILGEGKRCVSVVVAVVATLLRSGPQPFGEGKRDSVAK